MEHGKISIIVPIYNVYDYVGKCLDSLIKQTYKNIEILAIIDGSPDRSIDIVSKYALKDKRIKCIEKENGGYGSVLEYAIKMIKTEYFLICDPDDWLAENAIEVLYSTAKKNKLDIVVGDKYLVYSDNSEIEYASSKSEIMDILPNKIYKGEEAGKLACLSVSPHSKLFKTSLAKNIIFPHKVSYTDFLLFLVSVNSAKRVMYIDKALSYYLVDRVGNTATDVSLKAVKAALTVFESTINELEKNNCNNKFIYYRVYDQFRYAILGMVAKLKKDDYSIIVKNLNKYIFMLKGKKKDIKQLINYNSWKRNLYNKLMLDLMLNNITSKMAILFAIKVLKKRKERNV